MFEEIFSCPTALRRHREGPLASERSEEHTSELQSPCNLVCRLLLEKKKKKCRPRSATQLLLFRTRYSHCTLSLVIYMPMYSILITTLTSPTHLRTSRLFAHAEPCRT